MYLVMRTPKSNAMPNVFSMIQGSTQVYQIEMYIKMLFYSTWLAHVYNKYINPILHIVK